MPYSRFRISLLICVLVFLSTLAGTALSAQRSLYQDALLLAGLDGEQQPTLTVILSNPAETRLRIEAEDTRSRTLDVTQQPVYTFAAYDRYDIYVEGAAGGDRLIVNLLDTQYVYSVPRDDWNGVLTIGYNHEGSDFVEVIAPERETAIFPSVNESQLVKSAYYYPILYRAMNNAEASHGNGKLYQAAYASNPFLAGKLESANARMPKLRLEVFKESIGGLEEFSRSYYAVYPYEKIMAGDSILDFRRNLSITTTTSSYRSQIVTAQEQLRSANSEINQQRKSSGALNATTIAVGLSDFIAERAQEELNLTFFNRFKENLKKESELTKLFPATRDLMFKFEISNYKTFLAHARETFQNDLDNLGLNVPGILELEKYKRLRNDPNVFNLSLIYSIAELAYREEPVENILLASLQQLHQRKTFLNKSINLAITDSLLNGMNTGSGAARIIDFRKKMKTYTQQLNTVLGLNAGTLSLLWNLTEEEEKQLVETENSSEEGITLSGVKELQARTIRELQSNIREEFTTLSNYFYLEEYQEKGGGSGGDVEHLAFAEAYITTKLDGKDYHQNRLDGTGETDYEAYYSQEPIPIEENIVAGIDASRNFLRFNYEKKFGGRMSVLNGLLDSLTQVKFAMAERGGLTADVVLEKVSNVLEKQESLINAYVWELSFWKDATGETELDHYIGGLQYLANRLQRKELSNLVAALNIVKAATDNPDDNPENAKYNLYDLKTESMNKINEFVITLDGALAESHTKLVEQTARLKEVYGRKTSVVGEDVGGDFRLFAGEPGNPNGISIAMLYDSTGSIDLMTYDLIQIIKELDYLDVDEEIVNIRDVNLTALAEEVSGLEEQRQELLRLLETMEAEYADQLVGARANSNELSSVMELTTHLLFAFRNYDRVYDTLYYQDTQRIEITVELPPDVNGLVSTYKTDSLAVFNRIVPGTTERVTSARWISREEFDALRKNRPAWNIFLGLLYQRMSSVEGMQSLAPEGVALIATKFFELTSEMEEQRNQLRRKRAGDPRSITFRDYYPFIRSTVDLFNTVITAPLFSLPQLTVSESGRKSIVENSTDEEVRTVSFRDRSRVLSLVPHISNEALSLYENIFVKNYGNAVLNATELMKVITGQLPVFADAPRLSTPVGRLTKDQRRTNVRNTRGINAVFRYGSFMASMIDARTSNQVKTILKSTTLPPGSSRIKREVLSNFTINSYLGAAIGRDRLLDAPTGFKADAFGAALSVPIGLTYSFSPGFLRNRSSFSIHVPLLDLGAITAYRSNPSGNTANVNNLPELQWKNLFSPGAYFVYNFADSPFSLGLGGQYGPQLREIVPENGEALFLNSWRFPMIFMSIDVPFFNLHTGARKVTPTAGRRYRL